MVQVMVCGLTAPIPLPESMLTYCQLDLYRNSFSEISIKINFPFKNTHLKMSSVRWWVFCPAFNVLSKHVNSIPGWPLTLHVRDQIIPVQQSASWLLMAWLLVSPEHQHPWHWLCSIGKFLSYMRKDCKYLRHVSVEEWYYRYPLMFPMKNLPRKGLILSDIKHLIPTFRQMRTWLGTKQCASHLKTLPIEKMAYNTIRCGSLENVSIIVTSCQCDNINIYKWIW